MRVPIPWVVILCLLAVAIPVSLGVRGKDFITPPDEATLEAIRMRAESSIPRISAHSDAISPQDRPGRLSAEAPVIHLGNLARPPQLDEYADRARQGAAHLIELANRLEDNGHAARALLAWERVIDTAQSGDSEAQAAISAISRLRESAPPWPGQTANRPGIVVHAGSGARSSEALTPILEEAAARIAKASAGTVQVASRFHAGPDIDLDEGPVPVAMWISGDGDVGKSTEVRSFTISTPESIEYDAYRAIYLLVHSYLRNSPEIRRPPIPADETDIRQALGSHITRLQWHEFGRMLSTP